MRFAALLLLLVALPVAAAGTAITDFLGQPVFDPRGNLLGEVTDVIFDARDGAILSITVDYGRWLRVASHEADFDRREIARVGERLVLDVPEAKLRRMPQSRRPEWPAVSADWLIGRRLRDSLRRDTGEMVDLVADFAEGTIEQALIDFPDELDAPTKRVALPLEAISLPHEFGGYPRLNVLREHALSGSDKARRR